jgi:hypothetical protein
MTFSIFVGPAGYAMNFVSSWAHNIINNLSVRKKIFVASNIGIFFILLLCIIFIGSLYKQRMLIDDIFNKRFHIYKQSSEIVRKINVIHANMYKGYVWALTGYQWPIVETLLTQQIALLDESSNLIKDILKSDVLTEKERNVFTSILKNHEEYKIRSIYAKDSALQGGDITTASVMLQMGDEQFLILYENLNELMKIQNDLSRESHENSIRSFANVLYFTSLFVACAVFISIFISITISRFLMDPVSRLVRILRKSSVDSVDFSLFDQIESKDEIGMFARYFKKYLTDIKTTTHELVATRDALWGEMKLAKKIQTTLLPKSPCLSGYEVSVHMTPAEEVGGDYYDIINAAGRDWIIIGDVSGHGVPAGLIMMMLQTSIKTVLSKSADIAPSKLIADINVVLTHNIKALGEDKYITLLVLAIHENGRLIYSGLHEDIMIYRAGSREVELIKTEGMWLGIRGEIGAMLQDASLHMEIGDILLLYTDGVTDAVDGNGDRFSKKHLEDALRQLHDRSTEAIKDGILSALEHYQQQDDVTMIVIRRLE